MTHTSDPVCPGCQKKLEAAHPILAQWFNDLVKPKYPDAHISCSYRGKAEQDQAVSSGKSKAVFPTSAHNKVPSLALDLFEQVNGGAIYRPKFYLMLSQDSSAAGYDLKWGGNFKSIGDADHFELNLLP